MMQNREKKVPPKEPEPKFKDIQLRDARCPNPQEHNEHLDGAFSGCERSNIEGSFAPGSLLAEWKIVTEPKTVHADHEFLCLDWALFRMCQRCAPPDHVLDFIKVGTGMRPTDGCTVKEFMDEKLNDPVEDLGFEFQECPTSDLSCVAIAWQNKREPIIDEVGHISVKYKGNWESKLSNAPYVITHGIDDFKNFNEFKLEPVMGYKVVQKKKK